MLFETTDKSKALKSLTAVVASIALVGCANANAGEKTNADKVKETQTAETETTKWKADDEVTTSEESLAELLDETSTPPPPIHLVTGAPTTLGQLARVAIGIAGTASEIRQAPPRSFDVARFYGDPERARRLLGWEATVGIEAGVRLLASRFEALDRGETI